MLPDGSVDRVLAHDAMPAEGDLAQRLVERGAARFAHVEVCEDLDADDTGGAYAM